MAVSSLLALLDDIASVLDDVALLTKVAAGKTAGVLGDDLAINAEQVADIRAERELPVVWAVAKGSFKNKLILVPAALLIAATLPSLITVLLMVGGAWLCYEGSEKVWHSLQHRHIAGDAHKLPSTAANSAVNARTFEQQKIRGAIRTDFVLSAEIIVIALGTVREATFLVQFLSISAIALLITFGVYGTVAAIVKLDDLGVYLLRQKTGWFLQTCGRLILRCAPHLMRSLSVIGTVAMFIVGGGILLHELPYAHVLIHRTPEYLHIPATLLLNLLGGMLCGIILLLCVLMWHRLQADDDK